jgi:KUP system potassium uptake protein
MSATRARPPLCGGVGHGREQPQRPKARPASRPRGTGARGWAALAALGVVCGDLGTSPLYTLQAVVQAMGGRFTPEAALGILSLIFWTLIVTVSGKYCLFVMRADNRGEGGILTLMSLVGGNTLAGKMKALAVMGLLGAALFYGDGVITPAISVLSALEGVNVVTPGLAPYVMPIAVGVLIAFFAVQRFGTARIGAAFGPIMLAWFIVIGGLGLSGIVRDPAVLTAVDPRHAIGFLRDHGLASLAVLGGVFLCATGGEALYSDMGHFGAGPIRLSWYGIALPALLLCYAGQTALVIEKGVVTGNPFFQLAPAWAVYPLVGLATVATIIASQSIITGAFSMTRQAMQLGWLPGFIIRQTSSEVYGQVYVPTVNWLMMVATIATTLAFRRSDQLAGAYGTAISITMLLTTCLLFVAMRKLWRWPLALSALVAGGFLSIDIGFFAANLLKIAAGGWLPLTLGGVVFAVMLTWRWGITTVNNSTAHTSATAEQLLEALAAGETSRLPGTAIFLTRTDAMIPPLMMGHVRRMGALHHTVIALSVLFDETPLCQADERGTIEQIGPGVWRATLRFGFTEPPDLPAALTAMRNLDPAIDIENAVYFASRDLVVASPLQRRRLASWRVPLFAFLFRNAVKAVDRFSLPRGQVIEIARTIEI